MSEILVDLRGGDLGRAKVPRTTALEFQILIPHIAHILSELRKITKINSEHEEFRYAFEFSHHDKDMVLMVINSVKLPSNVEFYTVDGNSLFEIRGASGGVAASLIVYMMTKGE